MRECWLRTNVRVLFFSLILAAIVSCAGVALIVVGRNIGGNVISRIAGWSLVSVGVSAVILLLVRTRIPRIGYQDEHLLVYLNGFAPFRVPIEVVECFFLGQGSSMIKSRGGQELETATVVVRLAESAKEWHHRDVHRLLGHWCDGYITIRGTWCESLTADLLRELNARLVQMHRQQKQRSEATAR